LNTSEATYNGALNHQASNKNYGIIAFSHLRWSFVWQRPQQFLSRFAQSHPVLFIEEADCILEPGDEPGYVIETPQENITVARLQLRKDIGRGPEFEQTAQELVGQIINEIDTEGRFARPLLWFYNPMDTPWAVDQFNRRGVVYDCMDELSQFKFAPERLIENEKELLEKADIVFTGGYELWTRKRQQHANSHFFGCGVEYDHFSKAQQETTEIPEDARDIARPVLGWFGVIDERMDYDLVAEMAAKKPEWNFVMAGPVVKVSFDDLPKAPNIHWLGQKDYAVLPNYCKAFDVCMMCFAINEATEFINPTKALEYLATGRPVISTPVRDVVRQYTEYVDIAANAEEFIEAAERALSNPDRTRIEKGIEKSQQCSWESTVSRMQELIEQAIGADEQEEQTGEAVLT
jgi:glycosyltransferase involved in cell wall biosynthesis